MLRNGYILMLFFSAVVLVNGQVNCGGEQDRQFTRYVLSTHNRMRKARNLSELTYSCKLGSIAKKAVQGCPEALPAGSENDANFGRYELEDKISASTLAVRILYYWKNRDQINNMLRNDASTVACSVEVCPESDKENTIVMACFYGNPDGDLIVETTPAPIGCGGMDEETISSILQKHDELRKTSGYGPMKWKCELEEKAKEAVKECPESLPNESEANFARLTPKKEVKSEATVARQVLLRWARGKEKQKMAQADKDSVGCSVHMCPEADGKYPLIMACFYD